ncbi:MAG: hypothetical protein IPK80_08455 [Nannocystis sp.]|nr:hypothetical protein [Nannocystis sp.]
MAYRPTSASPRALALTATTLLLALSACPSPDPATTDSAATDDTTTGATTTDAATTTETTGEPLDPACEGLQLPPVTDDGCAPLPGDYQPRLDNSADDAWPACISDAGTYALIEPATGTVARIEAYEDIADLLWRGDVTPSAEDFTAARDLYVLAEGLESRLVRREDLHYPEIPMADWDPQIDPDKQCTLESNYKKYPERCIGPSKISPLVVDAFAKGQAGTGDPQVLAATIDAGLLWFLYLSVYKEANTCATVKAKDCDSGWAYYTGGQDLAGGLGIASPILKASFESHARIWDGILAVRCWRDLYSEGGAYPTLADIDPAGQALFNQGWEQLDQALHRGFALIIRERLAAMITARCDNTATAAHWAFLQVAGPVLDREADQRDAAQAAPLKALWPKDSPTVSELQEALLTLDALFPCG